MALNTNTPVENKVVAEFIIGEDGSIHSEPQQGKTTTVTVNEDGSIVTETIEDKTSENIEIFFEPGNFVENLGYMGKGMLGIFVVIGIIIISVTFLSKIGRKKSNN